jgi:hypothetical protein
VAPTQIADGPRHRLKTAAAHVVRAAARIVIVVLALRVGLLLFAPRPDDERVAWFLADTQPLIDPFRVVMHSVFIDPWNGSILDTLSIAAMIGYAILEAILVRAIWYRRPHREPLPPIPAELLARPPDARAPRFRTRLRTRPPDRAPTTAVSGEVRVRRD